MRCRFLALLFLFSISSISLAQETGDVFGKIIDSTSQSGLSYASIRVKDVPIGARTDVEGNFRLFNIPVGEQTLMITYLGYQLLELPVTITKGENEALVIKMIPESFFTDEVVISAQVEGQQAAINQQINSNTIVNVVSKDKIQSLPDQNAAETVGRLPGISVQRDAGEGTKIVVRGLSPRFNSITVNGERIPSTDSEDRSVDLSMISTDALEGIEVFKALTPDKDGDAVGGTVNFVIKKASEGFRGSVKLQGGFNSQQEELGQPRGSFNLSNRFLNKKLGIILTGNFQRANRSSDVLNATYTQNGVDQDGRSNIFVTNLNLSDRLETRYRFGGSLSMDYQLKNGSILLSSFLGRTERNDFRRRRRYRLSAAYQEYDVRTREINTFLSSNSLSGTHNLGLLNMELSWRASLSFTDQQRPYVHQARFRELAGFRADVIEDQGPELIPDGAKNRIDQTWFKDAFLDSDAIRDRNATSQVDLKLPFSFKELIDGYLKFGGKIRDKARSRDLDRQWTQFDGINEIIADHPEQFDLDNQNRMLMSNFLGDFQPENFLEGQYEFGPGLNIDAINQFAEDYRSYYQSDGQFDLQDYSATEQIRAAYIMSEINLFKNKLMILPGVRMENTQTSYGGFFALPNSNGDIVNPQDTVGGQDYTELLPMLHLRYKFAKWVDLRLAATRTLARPNYFNLVPWYRINDFETFIEQGEPNLKHTKVWNYDAFLSFYNKFGLFTIGAFYKELEDIDYIRSSKTIPAGRSITYDLLKPENAEGISVAKGLEFELQTNLRFFSQAHLMGFY